MALSPVIAVMLGTEPEVITWPNIIGGVIMVAGIVMTEPQFFAAVRKVLHAKG